MNSYFSAGSTPSTAAITFSETSGTLLLRIVELTSTFGTANTVGESDASISDLMSSILRPVGCRMALATSDEIAWTGGKARRGPSSDNEMLPTRLAARRGGKEGGARQ